MYISVWKLNQEVKDCLFWLSYYCPQHWHALKTCVYHPTVLDHSSYHLVSLWLVISCDHRCNLSWPFGLILLRLYRNIVSARTNLKQPEQINLIIVEQIGARLHQFHDNLTVIRSTLVTDSHLDLGWSLHALSLSLIWAYVAYMQFT